MAAWRVLGPEHPNTLTTTANLAATLHQLGRAAEAEPLQRQVLEASRRVLGPEHPDTLRATSMRTWYPLSVFYSLVLAAVLWQVVRLLARRHAASTSEAQSGRHCCCCMSRTAALPAPEAQLGGPGCPALMMLTLASTKAWIS